MDELITIIVPVYNASKYLERCISSVTSQSYTALQIILVNDGSTDGSSDMCDAFARQDTRIEVIHQANGGVSAARNAGLDCARGAWITFVDADDYVSPYYIEDMLTAAVRDGCDMTICHHVKVPDDNNESAAFQRTTDMQCITGREVCVQRFGRNSDIYNSCWGKLIRVCMWTGLRYPNGRIAEDLFLSHELFYRAGHIAIIDAVLYAYVQSGDSIMRSAFSLRRLEALDSWQEGVRFFRSAGDSNLAHIAQRVYCGRTFDALYICKRELPHEREALRLLRMRAIKAYIEAKPMRGYTDCSPRKAFAYRLMLFIGRWCPPLYAVIFIRRSTWRMYI